MEQGGGFSAAIVVTVYTGGAAAGAWSFPGTTATLTAQAYAVVAVGGFAAGAIQTGSLRGAATGAVSAAAFYGIGSSFQGAGWAHEADGSLSMSGYAAKTLAHGVAGGVMSSLQGGNFGHGFASAGFGEAVSPVTANIRSAGARIVAASVMGGTASSLAGGKFANGAVTAAFGCAFNEILHTNAKEDAERRLDAAEAYKKSVLKTLMVPKFSTTDEAAAWFSDMMQDASTRYRLEFMANIEPAEGGGFRIRDVTTGNIFSPRTGVGYSGHMPDCLNCSAWTHTHAIESSFSPDDLTLPGRENQTAYVSMPSGTIDRYTAADGIVSLRVGQ